MVRIGNDLAEGGFPKFLNMLPLIDLLWAIWIPRVIYIYVHTMFNEIWAVHPERERIEREREMGRLWTWKFQAAPGKSYFEYACKLQLIRCRHTYKHIYICIYIYICIRIHLC